MELSVEELRRRIGYDSETGALVWLRRPSTDFPSSRAFRIFCSCYVGKPALNCLDRQGYLYGRFDGRAVRSHRVAWAIHFGTWPENEIDHINGDRRDNRIENLRDVPRRDNARNVAKSANSSTPVVGVGFRRDRGTWRAYVGSKHIGTFQRLEDAVVARKRAERDLGFHPNHGRTQNA